MTETMQSLIRRAIDVETTDLHVCLPGRIESYDTTTALANVKPMISRRFRGVAEVVEYPVIPRVPVVQPRTASAQMTLPVAKGDACLLVFADRSLANWQEGPGSDPVEPRDVRRHHLSDAFAILGGYPTLVPSPPKNPDAFEILVKPDTKIALGNGAVELVQLVHDLMDYIETTITFSNGGGPTGPPTNAAAVLAPIRLKLEQLKV